MPVRDPITEPKKGPVACRDCGKPAQFAISTKDTNRRVTEASFDYYRCTACGLWFLWPVPENLDDYYLPEYYSIPPTIEALHRAASLERYKLDLLTPYLRGGRLLEIGPSVGTFAYLAKEAGFQVETVERDARCCQYLEKTVGVRATCSADVVRAVQGRGPYDAAVFWHVVEHLEHPRASLEAVASELRPGGVLAVAMPNPQAFQFRVLGVHWTHVDAPRHVYLIPAATLTGWLDKAGMAPLWVTTSDRGGRTWNVFGWQVSLRNRFRIRLARVGASLAGRALARLAAPLELGGLRGSCYTVLFRK